MDACVHLVSLQSCHQMRSRRITSSSYMHFHSLWEGGSHVTSKILRNHTMIKGKIQATQHGHMHPSIVRNSNYYTSNRTTIVGTGSLHEKLFFLMTILLNRCKGLRAENLKITSFFFLLAFTAVTKNRKKDVCTFFPYNVSCFSGLQSCRTQL